MAELGGRRGAARPGSNEMIARALTMRRNEGATRWRRFRVTGPRTARADFRAGAGAILAAGADGWEAIGFTHGAGWAC